MSAHDANGNRASKTLGGVTETYVNDDADKLDYIHVGGTTVKDFSYDTAGRTTSVVTSAGTTSVAYDSEGRITTITYPNLSTNTFTYNGLDTRVGKVDSTGTRTYKRDGAYVTDPVLSDGAAGYTPGISERRSGTTKFYHQDRLGTTERLTNTSQSTTDTRSYDAFGLLLASTGSTPTPFGFAGAHGYQEDPDSGLKLLGHRYYDPSTGRFLTRDPIKDGRNWYVYCNGNPAGQIDPQGLQSIDSPNSSLKAAIARGKKVVDDLLETWELVGGVPQKFIEAARAASHRLGTKARDIIAREKKGLINREFPQELRERTLDEIRELGTAGNSAARKALKLLREKRFDKPKKK